MAPSARVRFAPSPTGHLHVGGARTAIYNWLFARREGGRFILRIDDTDRERSTPEYTEAIFRGMRWLGLDWDEGPEAGGDFGPYFQSERMDRYAAATQQLIDTSNAYKCFCSPDDLECRRDEAIKAKRPSGYDRKCRHMRDEERAHLEREGAPFAVRFAVPLEGETSYDDAIRGTLAVENAHVEDFVLVRSDGTPTYNFASTVDDIDMRITHVIRGDDHISNTPKQILIARALSADAPVFAHLPMIWGSDKTRLSKRHGATSIEAYRDAGYLPEALLNFLALLGWSADAMTTVLSRDELVEAFSLDRVSSSPAIFDTDKLDWMNGEYIRRLDDHDFIQRAKPFLEAAGRSVEVSSERGSAWWGMLARLTRQRVKTMAELPDLVRPFFEEVHPDEAARAKALSDPAVSGWLAAVADALEALEHFHASSIEAELRALPEKLGAKPKALFAAVRVAVTGRPVSPPLFESIELLGRKEAVARLRKVAG